MKVNGLMGIVFAGLLAMLLLLAGCPVEEETTGPGDGTTTSAAPPATSAPAAETPAAAEPLGDQDLEGEVNIAGGTAHIPVMEEVQKIFAEQYPKVKITIAGGGSGVGIEQVGEGLVQIGNSGRAPKQEEIDKYGLVQYRWAIDGVTAVVHPDNTVGELTKDQMIKVFSGEITNWQELGGEDHGINVYTRDEESGTRKVFVDLGLDKGSIVAGANVVASNGAMKSAVAQDPYAIGYVSVGHVDETVQPVALDGVAPTLENVKSGAFTVSRGLYSLTKGEAEGATKVLLDFLYSEEGQAIISDKGFIPADR